MTEPTTVAPAPRQITIDAVAGLFQRRELRERDEALNLAADLRTLTDLCNRQQAIIERLNTENARLAGLVAASQAGSAGDTPAVDSEGN